jgi:hypothetical protein
VRRNVASLCEAPRCTKGRPSKSLTFDQATKLLAAAQGTSMNAYIALAAMRATHPDTEAPRRRRENSLERRYREQGLGSTGPSCHDRSPREDCHGPAASAEQPTRCECLRGDLLHRIHGDRGAAQLPARLAVTGGDDRLYVGFSCSAGHLFRRCRCRRRIVGSSPGSSPTGPSRGFTIRRPNSNSTAYHSWNWVTEGAGAPAAMFRLIADTRDAKARKPRTGGLTRRSGTRGRRRSPAHDDVRKLETARRSGR